MNNELKLLPPDDKMVTTKLENFDDKMLMLRGFKNRQELTEKMFLLMKQYAGLGLSANQVGLPYKMFVKTRALNILGQKKLYIMVVLLHKTHWCCYTPMIGVLQTLYMLV